MGFLHAYLSLLFSLSNSKDHFTNDLKIYAEKNAKSAPFSLLLPFLSSKRNELRWMEKI